MERTFYRAVVSRSGPCFPEPCCTNAHLITGPDTVYRGRGTRPLIAQTTTSLWAHVKIGAARVNKQGPTEGEGGGAGEERADELAVLRNPPGLAACPRAVAAEEPSVRVSDSVVYPGERRCGRARARFDLKSSQSNPASSCSLAISVARLPTPTPRPCSFHQEDLEKEETHRHAKRERGRQTGREGNRENVPSGAASGPCFWPPPSRVPMCRARVALLGCW